MTKLILILAMVLLPIVACAMPQFLACDPSPDPVTQVEVEITYGGTTAVYTGIYNVVGADALLYDLSGRPNGNYVFRARWAGSEGWWSDWSDSLSVVKSGKPGNFRIK